MRDKFPERAFQRGTVSEGVGRHQGDATVTAHADNGMCVTLAPHRKRVIGWPGWVMSRLCVSAAGARCVHRHK